MKINILDFNHCNLEGCDCGWNITLSGSDEKTLEKVKEKLKDFEKKDKVPYHEKNNQEKF